MIQELTAAFASSSTASTTWPVETFANRFFGAPYSTSGGLPPVSAQTVAESTDIDLDATFAFTGKCDLLQVDLYAPFVAPIALTADVATGHVGDVVTISGRFLMGTLEATVGGMAAAFVVDDYGLTCAVTVPAVPLTGDAPIVLSNDAGQSAAIDFTVVP